MQEKPPIPDHRRIEQNPNESIGPGDGTITGHLLHIAADLRRRHFTRPVTTFTSIDGKKYKAAADQVYIDSEDPSRVKVWLRTHNNKEIIMTTAGVLATIGAIALVKNRSQRKKMSYKASSYRRKPRK